MAYFAYEVGESRILNLQAGTTHCRGNVEMDFLNMLRKSSFGCSDKRHHRRQWECTKIYMENPEFELLISTMPLSVIDTIRLDC